MRSKRIVVPRPVDPFQKEIDERMNKVSRRDQLERLLAVYFSYNKMPPMSGDMRDRLPLHRLRELKDCVDQVEEFFGVKL